MAILCSCNGICTSRLNQATKNNAGSSVRWQDLYNESLALKKEDSRAPIAAHNSNAMVCAKCNETFQDAAAQHNKSAKGVGQIVQSLEVLALPAPKIPA